MTGAEGVVRQNRATVGLNLTWLVPGVVGGSEEYTIRLLTGLRRCADSTIGFRVYGRQELFDHYPELGELFTPIVMPGQRISKARRVAMEQTWLAGASSSDDALHHLGGTIPLVRPRRSRAVSPQRVAVTIHDLQPVDLARNFKPVKRWWLSRLIPFAVGRADLIVTPSRFTAERIAARYGADPARLRVVAQGHDTHDRPDGVVPSRDLPARLESRRFLLYPAIAYRHKRHRDLIDALACLPGRLADVDLVFCGRPGPETERLKDHARRLGLVDRVHLIGRVPESDLHWLYHNATALTFASEYEGFGNPCLEAMARGCPVLAADATALPEVVGDAALLLPVGDVRAWARAIVELVERPELAADLIERGHRRAGSFDPGMASERLWTVYRELLSPTIGDRLAPTA